MSVATLCQTPIFATDGDTSFIVADVWPGPAGDAKFHPDGSSEPAQLTVVGDKLFFFATDSTHGRELWMTDGDTTRLVRDINPGPASSVNFFTAAYKDQLYFRANDGTHGQELWRSDGQTTELLADISPGPDGSSV